MSATLTTVVLYNKLMSYRSRPFHAITICSHSLFIDEHDSQNDFMSDHPKRALHPWRSNAANHHHQHIETYCRSHQQFMHCKPATFDAKQSEEGSCKPEYTIDKFTGHLGACDNIRYTVRWYEYSASDSTVKLSYYIAQRFIARHW